jgi:hypothetical protein
MEPLQASVTGTVRIIAILILVWAVLRLLRNRSAATGARKAPGWAPSEQRPKGEVRIERIKDAAKDNARNGGKITDADFEEVK